MKRLYTLLLIAGLLTTSAMGKVKPRHPKAKQGAATEQNDNNRAALAPMRVGSRSTAPLTSMGCPKIPLILVQFADLRFTSGLEEGQSCQTKTDIEAVNSYYDKFANGLHNDDYYTGHGSRGAITEYFRDQSDGQFTPEFVVIGPVTLSKSYTYYGQDSGDSHDIHVSEFYTEAIKKAQELQSNWDIFDNNNDNSVDMAFFVYAGEGENGYDLDEKPEAKNYIWPHEQAGGGTINGIKYGCYACCNELYMGRPDGIGVFCHELSHALGMPDLYDYHYVAYGMDYWDLMDSGNYCMSGYCPCGYSSYEKDFMGWKPLITLSMDEPQHLTLVPVSMGGSGYKILNPENPNEYYILENRQNKRWDAYIARGSNTRTNHGLLISHVDYSQSAWTGNYINNNASHQRFTIVPADEDLISYALVETNEQLNAWYISTAGDPFPGSLGITALESEKEPVFTSTGATPGQMNQPLRNIVELDNKNIELDYCPRGVEPIHDGIASMSTESANADIVYDLSGRRILNYRLSDCQLPSGIYIINHRKVIIP